MGRLALIAWFCFAASNAMAQGATHEVRKIAPERFQPNPRADAEGPSKSVTISAPSKEHPHGGCEKSAREWIFCLRSTADLSDTLVREAEEAASKVLLNRPSLNAVTAQGFVKDLKEAGVKWLALREVECGKLAFLEKSTAGSSAYEARMLCQIERDMERADQITARYGATIESTAHEAK